MKIFFFILSSLLTICTYSDTLYVANTFDSGPGSLRESIRSAQNYDVIEFDMDFFQNANLTIELDSQINITKHLVMNGIINTNDSITLSGNNTNRIFHIEQGIQLNLNNLVLTNGFTNEDGGAILCSIKSALHINNCIIRNCEAQNGGAISIQSTTLTNNNTELININNTICENNEASENGGCINISGQAFLNISHSIIRNCKANNGGGISDINSLKNDSNPHIALNKVYMNNNNALKSGGAIFTETNTQFSGVSKIELNYSSLYKNTAGIDGGGISMNVYSCPAYWGSNGVYYYYSSTTNCVINNSTLAENYSQIGSTIKMKSKVSSLVKLNNDNGSTEAFTILTIRNSTIKGRDSLQSNEILLDPRHYNGLQYLDGFTEVNITSSILVNPGNIKVLEYQKVHYNQTNVFSNVILDSSSYNIFSDSIQEGSNSTDLLNVAANEINFLNFGDHGGVTPTLSFKVPSIAHNNGNPEDFSDAQNKTIKDIRDIGAFENCNTYHPVYKTAFNTYTWMDGITYTETDSNIYFKEPVGDDYYKIHHLFLSIIHGDNISVHPNPISSNSVLYIDFKSPIENTETIQLINSMGKVIFKKSISVNFGINRQTLTIPELDKGVYIIQIVNANLSFKVMIY